MNVQAEEISKVVVVPTTAGEQIVIDTWDLASLDGAWRR